MKCFIGLGTNIGDARYNLESAAKALADFSIGRFVRVSPIYRTPAMVPQGAPAIWNIPFSNAVAEIDSPYGPEQLLRQLKQIESALGRDPAPRWAPRSIDLDLLSYGTETIRAAELNVPHTEMFARSFVLDPLKDLASSRQLPGQSSSVSALARRLPGHMPLIMGILNVTPDSFSDGGQFANRENALQHIHRLYSAGVAIIDIGAESTRPGATPVEEEEEWRRLEPILAHARGLNEHKLFRPILSVDTRRASIAARALTAGADWINDVSGVSDEGMLRVLEKTTADYILTHSLTIPADPQVVLPVGCDPIFELKNWLDKKLSELAAHGIEKDRVIFDPGIGFGKSPAQSEEILRRVNEFSELPVRIMVGHSRKSFMKKSGSESNLERDQITLNLSRGLSRAGVDILRVHEVENHLAAFSPSQGTRVTD